MEGIMTGIKSREKYAEGTGNEGIIESVKNKMNLIDMIAGGSGPDNTAQFLIGGGLNLIDPEYQGDNILQTVASA